ncbi:MAG: hypothetical protein MZV64_22190 [Ignavibacteriales bacterium]|nr:hypothetical protein [Ignavibacteriales bacterium]
MAALPELLVCQILNLQLILLKLLTLIKKQAANHLVDVYPVAAATVGRKGEVHFSNG